jgi:hypothetical protein
MHKTQHRLRELFEFDVEAGQLTWRSRPAEDFVTAAAGKIWNTRYAGTVAGYIARDGYRRIRIDGEKCLAHRMIWIYANGDIPAGMQIDHINGVRDDNRIANLRTVTHAENQRNSSMRSNNTSGVMGVSWNKLISKWQARIHIDGRRKHLGQFDTLEAAVAARAEAARKFGFHPGHGKSLSAPSTGAQDSDSQAEA